MDPIKTRRDGAILEVLVDRPMANAIGLATSRIMGQVFANFRDDPDLRVAILTVTGEKFLCPGWDLKAAADGDAVDGDYGVGGFGGLQELRDLNKPVIAAINGYRLRRRAGTGHFSRSCILAAEHATFALPEIRSGDERQPPCPAPTTMLAGSSNRSEGVARLEVGATGSAHF